jgi:hypothetical protein
MSDNNKLPNEDKELWAILGKVELTKASPMFTHNVMREIRLQKTTHKASLLDSLKSWRSTLIGIGMGLCATTLIAFSVKAFSPKAGNLVENSADNKNQPAAALSDEPIKNLASSHLTSDLSAIFDDDDLVGEFLVTITESPEILSEEDINNMLSF